MDDGPDFTYDKAVLASGSFGNVHKGTLKDTAKTPVVVKVPKGRKESESVEEEYAFLRKLRRTPGIVLAHSMRKKDGICTIALERANGSVRDLLGQHRTGFALALMKNLVGDLKIGLRELVARNILHRDIKPDNILYFQKAEREYSFKLSDFGTSRMVGSMDDTAATVRGTAMYMSPQLLGSYIGVKGCTKPKANQCDSWSTGVTLYECATGADPFEAKSLLSLYQVVQAVKSRENAIAYRDKQYHTKLVGAKFADDDKWRQLERLISILLRQCQPTASSQNLRMNIPLRGYTPVVGIDLGTTYSVAGIVLPNGKYEIVENQYRTGRLTPSCVAFAGRRLLIGQDALDQRPDNHMNTISQVKRFMGRNRSELENIRVANHMQYDEYDNPEYRVKFDGNEMTVSPQEISAMILKHVAVLAERALEEATGIKDIHIVDAVITVPANFNNDQRKATRDAARIAGLNVLLLLNEPTAAAIAYGLRGDEKKGRKILVYDLGGGTFDVSIIEMKGLHANVLVTSGILNLGGEDFDKALLAQVFVDAKQQKVTPKTVFSMIVEVERAKRELTEKDRVTITLPDNKKVVITRKVFTELIDHELQQTMTTVDEALAGAKLKPSDIDDVVLAGGSTRIPRVTELLAEKFGRAKLRRDIDADEAVAMGAIMLANSLRRGKAGTSSLTFDDVIPKGLGFAVRRTGTQEKYFDVLMPAFTRIPDVREKRYTNTYDQQKQILVEVYEGNSENLQEDHKIGEFEVSIVPRKPRQNKIGVNFSVDKSGILTVTATDQDTNLGRSIKIKSGALTEDRVDAMRAVAEQMMRKDQEENHMQELRARIEKRLRDVQRMAKLQSQLAIVCALKEAWDKVCAQDESTERDLEKQCSDLDQLKANWESVADIKEVA